MSYNASMSQSFSRYVALLELLQSGQCLSAQQLATMLGVQPRSIRRYVDELRSQGYQIISLRGRAGGYKLSGTSQIAPMNFSDDELLALSYGLLLLKTSPAMEKLSVSALARLEHNLPQHVQDKMRALRDVVNVYSPRAFHPLPSDKVIQLSQAARAKRRIQLRYRAKNDAISQRDCDPYAVVQVMGLWFMVGYCHLRHDLRIFRVDRMVNVQLRQEIFDPPNDFDAVSYVLMGIARDSRDRTEVVVDVALSLAEAVAYFPKGYVILQERSDGVRVTAYVMSFTKVMGWLLQADFRFSIVRPRALQIALKERLDALYRSLS